MYTEKSVWNTAGTLGVPTVAILPRTVPVGIVFCFSKILMNQLPPLPHVKSLSADSSSQLLSKLPHPITPPHQPAPRSSRPFTHTETSGLWIPLVTFTLCSLSSCTHSALYFPHSPPSAILPTETTHVLLMPNSSFYFSAPFPPLWLH